MSATLENDRREADGVAAIRRRLRTAATRGGAVRADAPAAGPADAIRPAPIDWPLAARPPAPPAAPVDAASVMLSKLRTAAPILLRSVASAAQAEAGDRVVRDLGRRVDAAIGRFLRETGIAAAALEPAQRALVQDLALTVMPGRAEVIEAVARALAPVDAVAMLAMGGLEAGATRADRPGWAADAMLRRGPQMREACLDVAHRGITDGAQAAIERETAAILLARLLPHPGLTDATRAALGAVAAAND